MFCSFDTIRREGHGHGYDDGNGVLITEFVPYTRGPQFELIVTINTFMLADGVPLKTK